MATHVFGQNQIQRTYTTIQTLYHPITNSNFDFEIKNICCCVGVVGFLYLFFHQAQDKANDQWNMNTSFEF